MCQCDLCSGDIDWRMREDSDSPAGFTAFEMAGYIYTHDELREAVSKGFRPLRGISGLRSRLGPLGGGKGPSDEDVIVQWSEDSNQWDDFDFLLCYHCHPRVDKLLKVRRKNVLGKTEGEAVENAKKVVPSSKLLSFHTALSGEPVIVTARFKAGLP